MKRILLSALAFMGAVGANAQTFDTVSVHDIQFVSQTDLQNCNDSSSYFGDTVTVVGYVVTPGGYAELASSSSPTGQRPVVNIVDTNNMGAGGPFRGIQIHGYWSDDNNNTITADILNNLLGGQLVYITGIVDGYKNETQFYPLTNTTQHISVPGTQVAQPQPTVVALSELQDNNTNNQLETGEQWEGSYVEFQNLTIIQDVSYVSGGVQRRQYIAQDASGNKVQIYDKFYAMRDETEDVVNPNSPSTNGKGPHELLQVGAQLDVLRGIIDHAGNDCLGGGNFDFGYRISPVFVTDIQLGATPPVITNVNRDILVPTDTESPVITADIVDPDGTIASATLFYTTDLTASPVNFTSVTMTNTSGDTYEASIPAQADGTTVGYYISSDDNDAQTSVYPVNGGGANQNVDFYTVRANAANGLTIMDIQYVPYPDQSDASSFLGEEVTVTGVVTSSMKDYDLGYVHIQDPNATENAGIMLVGALGLADLQRHQIVTVTGQVAETRELTQINVASIDNINNTMLDTITPVVLDPGNTAASADGGWEKYEGMLIEFRHPSNGRVHVTVPQDDPFGAWAVSSDASATAANSSLVMTGIQAAQNFSSVYVSVVNEDPISNSDEPLQVPAVVTSAGQDMEAMIGIMTARYEDLKLTPRNNDDIIDFSETLEPAQLEDTDLPGGTGIGELANVKTSVFPNPASDQVNIKIEGEGSSYVVEIYDLSGRMIQSNILNNGVNTVSTADLQAGVYITVIKSDNLKVATNRLIIQ